MSEPFRWHYGATTRFLVGAIGPPGERTFYVFLRTRAKRAWFLFEKGQAAMLGEQSLDLAAKMGWDKEGDIPPEQDVEFPAPPHSTDVLFRITTIAMQVGSAQGIKLVLEGPAGEKVTFSVTSDQLRSAAVMALKAVHSGRAQCPECLLPEDPAGHHCPSSNGHHRFGG